MKKIKIFAPATIANVSCGFDVLGLALDSTGDEMSFSLTSGSGVTITEIIGQDLPLEPENNVAGVAAMALLQDYRERSGKDIGVEFSIDKRIKPGSGIGSSAASSAGAVFGINQLLGSPYNTTELVAFAMEGERLASGVPHADNVAPALTGGFSLVRSYKPLDIIRIDSPKELFAVVVHPQIEVKTADSRRVIKPKITLQDAIEQWGNVGGLIAGLYREDYDLIGRSLKDVIIEPLRSILIPGFKEVTSAAKEAGALGAGISGSGPSIFALCRGEAIAKDVAKAMSAFYTEYNIEHDIHISKINSEGMRIICSE